MRFMMMIKGNEVSETGQMPDEKLVAAMMKYNDELINASALLAAEGLLPTSHGARVKFHRGVPTVTDGPFAEAKEVIAGYWLIQARSLAEAIAWAKRVPFEAGEGAAASGGAGQVEVRPIFELEDFPVSDAESGWREMEAEFRAATASSGPAYATQEPGGERLQQFVIFRMADQETEAEGNPMPSEELLAAMGRYNQEMIDAGVMLSGEGLKPSSQGARVLYANGKRTVVDGPFTETKELIAGFSVIQARSLDEALGWAKRWPPLDAGGEAELEVRQVFANEDFVQELPPELRAKSEQQRARMAAKE